MNEGRRSLHQAFLGAWILIVALQLYVPSWLGFGYGWHTGGLLGFVLRTEFALCALPIFGHWLALRGRAAGGGIVALACVFTLIPAFIALFWGFFYFVGVYPFTGLIWIAFLLANVAVGSQTLREG